MIRLEGGCLKKRMEDLRGCVLSSILYLTGIVLT